MAGRSRSSTRPARVTRCYEDVPARAVLLEPFETTPGFSAARTSPRGSTGDALSAGLEAVFTLITVAWGSAAFGMWSSSKPFEYSAVIIDALTFGGSWKRRTNAPSCRSMRWKRAPIFPSGRANEFCGNGTALPLKPASGGSNGDQTQRRAAIWQRSQRLVHKDRAH